MEHACSAHGCPQVQAVWYDRSAVAFLVALTLNLVSLGRCSSLCADCDSMQDGGCCAKAGERGHSRLPYPAHTQPAANPVLPNFACPLHLQSSRWEPWLLCALGGSMSQQLASLPAAKADACWCACAAGSGHIRCSLLSERSTSLTLHGWARPPQDTPDKRQLAALAALIKGLSFHCDSRLAAGRAVVLMGASGMP